MITKKINKKKKNKDVNQNDNVYINNINLIVFMIFEVFLFSFQSVK